MMGKNPLDMIQYKKVFGTCRVPHAKRDKLSFNNSKHVTVIHNNHVRLMIYLLKSINDYLHFTMTVGTLIQSSQFY